MVSKIFGISHLCLPSMFQGLSVSFRGSIAFCVYGCWCYEWRKCWDFFIFFRMESDYDNSWVFLLVLKPLVVLFCFILGCFLLNSLATPVFFSLWLIGEVFPVEFRKIAKSSFINIQQTVCAFSHLQWNSWHNLLSTTTLGLAKKPHGLNHSKPRKRAVESIGGLLLLFLQSE